MNSCTTDELEERALFLWMVKAILLHSRRIPITASHWQKKLGRCIMYLAADRVEFIVITFHISLGTFHKCAKANYLPCREMIIHIQKHICNPCLSTFMSEAVWRYACFSCATTGVALADIENSYCQKFD